MNKKKRYSDPLEAELEIFRLKGIAKKRFRKAEKLDAEADELRIKANQAGISEELRDDLSRMMEQARSKANRLRSHGNYVLTRRIPAIGRTKAKLLTQTMSFMGSDRSVVEEDVK